MVMVDELALADERGRLFCHLTADNVEELHAFVLQIGLKRCWFHNSKSAPHYDLSSAFRVKAMVA